MWQDLLAMWWPPLAKDSYNIHFACDRASHPYKVISWYINVYTTSSELYTSSLLLSYLCVRFSHSKAECIQCTYVCMLYYYSPCIEWQTEMATHTRKVVYFVWYLTIILIDVWPGCGLPYSTLPIRKVLSHSCPLVCTVAVNDLFCIVMSRTLCSLSHT